MDSLADKQLMLRVRDGDPGKLGVLFERHHRMLFNFFVRLTGNRTVSEDLVQEVFFRMLKYRHTYRAESSFTSWMYQIARNAQIDHFRKGKQEAHLDEGEDLHREEPVSRNPIPDELLEQQQEIHLLRRALSKLPPEKRELLLLSRFQNLKYQEIAEILACDVGTVKVRVFRTLRELAEIFSRLSHGKASSNGWSRNL